MPNTQFGLLHGLLQRDTEPGEKALLEHSYRFFHVLPQVKNTATQLSACARPRSESLPRSPQGESIFCGHVRPTGRGSKFLMPVDNTISGPELKNDFSPFRCLESHRPFLFPRNGIPACRTARLGVAVVRACAKAPAHVFASGLIQH